ncbi:unnamed protein product [Effrenium voratum]|nr:unnamed protein product [Effrenium voratum]
MGSAASAARMSDVGEVTSLVLRSSKKLSYEHVLGVLDRFCAGAYDYVYLPWPKLAVVNFPSPEQCDAARQRLRTEEAEEEGIRYVKEAIHQGLAANLALYCAKCDSRATAAGAPRVFIQGEAVSLRDALAAFVSPELLESFQGVVANSLDEAGRGRGVSDPTAGKEPEPDMQIVTINGPEDALEIPQSGNVIFRL